MERPKRGNSKEKDEAISLLNSQEEEINNRQ
jgi:hypothetical protein